MSQMMDVLSPRAKKNGETFWFKIGAAFPRDNGAYAIELNALPMPDENGRCMMLMSPKRDDARHD